MIVLEDKSFHSVQCFDPRLNCEFSTNKPYQSKNFSKWWDEYIFDIYVKFLYIVKVICCVDQLINLKNTLSYFT